ncbi:MAG: trigger factor [Candidatus Omnitrophica bacterium]|nr:trigger factor [Candidatus Omnitrophota bacterium]
MKCDIKNINQCTKVLDVTVPPIVVKETFDRVYDEIRPTAKVPGFRPGKAPRNILQMHYKNEAREEVLKRAVSSSFGEALKTNNIDPIGYPVFEDVKLEDDNLSYKAKIEIKPDIKLKKYKGVSAKRNTVEVTNEEMDQAIERIRENAATFNPVEDRGIKLGDYAVCDITSHIEGKPSETKKNEWCEIKENDLLSGFATQTVGMKRGEEKEITVTLSDKFPGADMQGKQIKFLVKVNEIKEKKLADLNEEFLKAAGDYKSVDEFKESIRKDIEVQKKQQEESKLEREIVDKIEKDVQFDLPESIVERRLSSLVDDGVAHLMRQGLTQEDAQTKKDELRTQYTDEAKRQVKVAFILDKIAMQEKIEENESDIERQFKKMALRMRYPVEEIKKYYNDNNLMESFRAEIRNQKVIDFIKENAEIK